jgi:3-isopropylmalate/(R)-2-methylmalate dehydratase small subunit
MQPFRLLVAPACPLPVPNVDTDQLIPARFMKRSRAEGYGGYLLHDMRFKSDGTPDPAFPLNQPAFASAQIIVARRNFGAGSSREAAVYALADFGIRCVIAPSFGDIHANNCAKNGLLPVVLPDAECAVMRAQLNARPGALLTVDLAAQTVTDAEGRVHRFDIHPVRKKCLLEGLDDIARTGQYAERIEGFEDAYRRERPWLYADPGTQ